MMVAANFLGALAPLLGSASAFPAQNALAPVSDWRENPTQLTLQVYVPSKIAAKPAVILALHYCGGTGAAYSQTTEYNSLADSKGFVVMYPSQAKDNHCWDVATAKTLTHDGGGDSTGLANMIKWAIKEYDADPTKIFVTGSSSGCMMSNVMAATYPDLVAAVSCYSGVAAGCLAGSPGSSPQSADPACANGQHVKTGAQWAAQVKAMYPACNGSYPRFQTWHGEADNFVNYPNLAEQLKEWSTILGVTWTNDNTNTPQSGYTQIVSGDGTKLVGYSARGVGHTVPVHEDADLKWFGISHMLYFDPLIDPL
ncbi:carbohydrate esterase family 1 protein [Diplogelasinospora grovesii]|uniref:Carboxylic ester hydrolase n=1 Tax=Diplogelasinospora grovesii TaxID=303347 RepID=A0AAN6RZB5_9PEZI|nr:carbohydrate esterase family 1 protein [Diplogelasinospora grovesii]